MSIAQIYDFEGVVEAAVKTVLEGQGLTVATTQEAVEFQRERPRVEVKYTHGPGLGRWATIVNGQDVAVVPAAAAGLTPAQLYDARRESAWMFTLEFDLLTTAQITLHADYRAKARAALATLWAQINGVDGMTRHAIELRQETGNSPMQMSQDQGYFLTRITFEGTISVQADAWSALNE